MNVAMDACSIINLANAGALQSAASLDCCRLQISPTVLGECSTLLAAQIADLHMAGLIDFIDGDDVPADRYLELLDLHNLGEGETECIAIAEVSEVHICSDDRRARRITEEIIGVDRVFGSLRLLRWCVQEDSMPCHAAFACLQEMRRMGGFVPQVQQDFFCAQV